MEGAECESFLKKKKIIIKLKILKFVRLSQLAHKSIDTNVSPIFFQ